MYSPVACDGQVLNAEPSFSASQAIVVTSLLNGGFSLALLAWSGCGSAVLTSGGLSGVVIASLIRGGNGIPFASEPGVLVVPPGTLVSPA